MLIEKKGTTADHLLNNKSEWNGTKMPRLRIESIEQGEVGKEDHLADL